MYVILVNDDNTLLITQKERIMQRSKLVDDLWFISSPNYKGYDMTNCTVMLEYLLPVSKSYKSEILVKSDDTYNGYLKYMLPFDTELTTEPGKIEVQLTFVLVDLDTNGSAVQRVRKTSAVSIDVIPITAWSDIIPDSALTAIDQRLIKTDAQIKALADIGDYLNNEKADDLSYTDGVLQLMANKKHIGKAVIINECEGHDGVPVVDFGSGTVNPDDPSMVNNVVEF